MKVLVTIILCLSLFRTSSSKPAADVKVLPHGRLSANDNSPKIVPNIHPIEPILEKDRNDKLSDKNDEQTEKTIINTAQVSTETKHDKVQSKNSHSFPDDPFKVKIPIETTKKETDLEIEDKTKMKMNRNDKHGMNHKPGNHKPKISQPKVHKKKNESIDRPNMTEKHIDSAPATTSIEFKPIPPTEQIIPKHDAEVIQNAPKVKNKIETPSKSTKVVFDTKHHTSPRIGVNSKDVKVPVATKANVKGNIATTNKEDVKTKTSILKNKPKVKVTTKTEIVDNVDDVEEPTEVIEQLTTQPELNEVSKIKSSPLSNATSIVSDAEDKMSETSKNSISQPPEAVETNLNIESNKIPQIAIQNMLPIKSTEKKEAVTSKTDIGPSKEISENKNAFQHNFNVQPKPRNQVTNRKKSNTNQSKTQKLKNKIHHHQSHKAKPAAASISFKRKPKTSSAPIIIITTTLIIIALIITAVGIYTRKMNVDYRRYAGRLQIPLSEEDVSLFNRETYSQPYHDNVSGFESWNQIQ